MQASIKVPEVLYEKLQALAAENKKFQKVCAELITMDNRERDLKLRYDRAKLSDHCGVKQSLRLQIMSLNETKTQFYIYAEMMQVKIDHKARDIRELYAVDGSYE